MVRCLLASVAVGVLGAEAFAQTPKPEVRRNPVLELHELPEVEVNDKDSAEVKAAKRWLLAEIERHKIIVKGIKDGTFAGEHYVEFTECLREMVAAAAEVFPEPTDQLPWCEFRVAAVKRAVAFNAPRLQQGVTIPQLGPQLGAEVDAAELALLKLQKRSKK